MTIITELMKAHELQPGDIFVVNLSGQFANWMHEGVGVQVYLRTLGPCPESERDLPVYRLTIDRTGDAAGAVLASALAKTLEKQ